MKDRLDVSMLKRGLAKSRHEANGLIMSGRVSIDGQLADKAGRAVAADTVIAVAPGPRYVSRGGLKLASVAAVLGLDFKNKTVLDVGSSTGGFSDVALQAGAARVYAVDVGTGQLDLKIRSNPRVVVMEKTDIRNVTSLPDQIDIALADVSFISLRLVLPAVVSLLKKSGVIVAMVKPQFEADRKTASMHKGIIKNNTVRRRVLRDFEAWAASNFLLVKKADSKVAGSKGNLERFYLLKSLKP